MSEPQLPEGTPTPGHLPASPPASSASPIDNAPKQTRRPHPLTPLIQGWIVFVGLAFFVVRDFLERDARSPWWEQLAPTILGLIVGTIVIVVVGTSFLSWYFTKFVIDADEVRVDTGWLFRQSKKIAIDKIQSIDIMQPFAARIFGLAELKIDVGADAATKLHYLTRKEAYHMRDTLLQRAHGLAVDTDTVDAASPTLGPPTSMGQLTDRRDDEKVLVTAKSSDLLIAGLFSEETFFGLLFLIVVFGLAIGFDVPVAGFVGIVPVALGILATLKNRIIDQFNYRLSVSPRGVKITRGLTSLTSQSVPIQRIQGVRISQSLMWRLIGKYRVQVDVLGYKSDTSDGENTSNILLPVGGPREVALALQAVLPGFDPRRIELRPSSRQARWLRPWFYKGLKHGFDERYLVTERGRWGRTTDIIPHARVQSVRVDQGPLVRRLGLAEINIDTTPGPVDAKIVHVDVDYAFAFAVDELARSAVARDLEDHPRAARSH